MTPVELDSSALQSSVAFTGRLACMSRAEAFEVVRQFGGTPSQAVTKRTKLLIVGELGWPLLDDGRPSNKLTRANAYGIPVANERSFLEWIGKAIPDSVHKTYSTDQLAALSKLSSDIGATDCGQRREPTSTKLKGAFLRGLIAMLLS
jgi:BRCT domain type II-containing protein